MSKFKVTGHNVAEGASSCVLSMQTKVPLTCRDSSNLSATGRKPGLRSARELVADLLATC